MNKLTINGITILCDEDNNMIINGDVGGVIINDKRYKCIEYPVRTGRSVSNQLTEDNGNDIYYAKLRKMGRRFRD